MTIGDAGDRPLNTPDSTDRGRLRVDLLVTALVMVVYVSITARFAEDLRTLLRIVLFVMIVCGHRWLRTGIGWGAVSAILVAGIALNPLELPNHHFVLTAVALSTALSMSGPDGSRTANLRANARWLLIILMGAATLQKALSPEFRDASYIGFTLATGGFAAPVTDLCTPCAEAVGSNVEVVREFRLTPPAPDAVRVLETPVSRFPTVATGFAVSILVIEGWLAVAFAFLPRRLITHLSLLAFAGTLGVLRQEYMFIAGVCLLGLLIVEPERTWIRRAYGLAALVFAAGAVS